MWKSCVLAGVAALSLALGAPSSADAQVYVGPRYYSYAYPTYGYTYTYPHYGYVYPSYTYGYPAYGYVYPSYGYRYGYGVPYSGGRRGVFIGPRGGVAYGPRGAVRWRR
jgi:hypothetical protein